MTGPATASTPFGALQGLAAGGVTVFRGVPYAKADRFQPPEPAGCWAGLRDATRHGPAAPQPASRLAAAMGGVPPAEQSEDCLTLTIATPACDGGKRPVLVWLHGGAWTTGAASLDWYDGASLAADGDIVVVGVNYRLGALGYLRHPAISPGNLGTLDQVAALRWVQAAIGAFGGDPGRVTVAGQSAGAASIGRIMLRQDAGELFRRVILQSGSFGRSPPDPAQAEAIGDALLARLGIDPRSPTARAEAAALPVAAILEAQGAVSRARARFGDTNPAFMPSVDAPTSDSGLIGAIADAAKRAGIDVLLGVTQDESHAFFAADPAMQNPDEASLDELFARDEGEHRPRDWYEARRPGGSLLDLVADRGTRLTFTWPTMRLADATAEAGVRVFAYLFAWAAPGNRFRACHCIELAFLFGDFARWSDAGMLQGGDPAQMAELSARVRTGWIAFVRDGSPGWPGYTAAKRETMVLGSTCSVVDNPVGLDG